MIESETNSILNDLLVELHRSLVQYAAEAWPWSTSDAQGVRSAVLSVAERQRQDASEVAFLLNERRQYLDFGVYSPSFTSLHYVALEFLFSQLKSSQQDLVQYIKSILPELRGDAEADQLVRKILQSEQEGLERLNAVELTGGPLATAWMK